MTPFFLDTGRHPCMGFKPWACPSENNSVNEFVNQMRRAQEEAKAALVKAKEDMAQYYDCRQTPAPVYKPGDHVYLDSSDIKTTRPSLKLSHRHLGPFMVEKKLRPVPKARACSSCFIPDSTSLRSVRSSIFYSMLHPRPNLTSFS
ncbi:hypothetical protein E4T56_gene5670 [Termitomyces sp. T112]|nr:hypothetical protein E4T56_gene5670 [Termitomyces sp. T112]